MNAGTMAAAPSRGNRFAASDEPASGELRLQRKYAAAEAELAEALKSTSSLVRANALEERARLRTARGQADGVVDDLRAADRLYAELGLEYNRSDTNTELSRVLLALKVSPYDQQVVQGAVLGVAILLDRVRARYFGRSRS